jgi:hypothetical protein
MLYRGPEEKSLTNCRNNKSNFGDFWRACELVLMSVQPSEMGRIAAYRGYEVVVKYEGHAWCVNIRPRRPDLPILSVPSFRAVSLRKEAWWPEAQRRIDRALASCLM